MQWTKGSSLCCARGCRKEPDGNLPCPFSDCKLLWQHPHSIRQPIPCHDIYNMTEKGNSVATPKCCNMGPPPLLLGAHGGN